MRNTTFLTSILGLMLLGGLVGCQTEQPSARDGAQLSAGYQALDRHQSDRAMESADEYLGAHPSGPGSAEALYLKGRAYEQKPAANQIESKANLMAARTAYVDALNQNPSPHTEGYIRASLSNVAFFEDDFPTALAEASRAYRLVDTQAIQSMLLFRMGVSEQRMGRFTEADRTFELVQQRYSDSSLAVPARQHEGLRDFYVQLATFNSAVGADRAAESMRGSGVDLFKRPDGGHVVLDAGPYGSYESAVQVKNRFAGEFPDAVIVP